MFQSGHIVPSLMMYLEVAAKLKTSGRPPVTTDLISTRFVGTWQSVLWIWCSVLAAVTFFDWLEGYSCTCGNHYFSSSINLVSLFT